MTSKVQTILVLGAGVGGLRCAIALANHIGYRKDVRVVLVDRNPYQIIQSTLYEVVDNSSKASQICLPVEEYIKKKHLEFWQDIVTAVDPVNQQVDLHAHGLIRYDYLVLAMGSQPDDYGILGLFDHAHLFHSFDQAVKLRRDLTHLLKTKDKVKLVIGGGGPAGVELAGTLANMRHTNGHMYIDVIEAASHILSGFPRVAVDKASEFLKKLEVGVYTNQPIKRVKNDRVILADDHSIPFDIFVWTGGVKANALVKQAGFETDKRGRAVVRPTLQAKGYARVYVIGDSASFEVGKKTLPLIATHARKESQVVAQNIIRQIKGRAPHEFHPGHYPSIIALGNTVGFLIIGPLVFWGRRFVWLRKAVNWYVVNFDLK